MRRLLFFAAKTCPPCARIWRDVITTQIIPHVQEGQVVKIMADEQPTQARLYGIKYTPTVVLVDENGGEYGRRVGDPTPRLPTILEWLTEVQDDTDTKNGDTSERTGTR